MQQNMQERAEQILDKWGVSGIPKNGKYVDAGFVAPINGSLKIASKPLNSDMVLILEKLEGGAL